MKIYLVGGAVRDQLLGFQPKERDWVVVGATPKQMLDLGFRQVGKDFPVFLHPKTQEEYALARIERKIGKGYTGFEFETTPKVTLEEDLKRRDLTINAIAQTDDGTIIDPFDGQKDLKSQVLRHISTSFAEDPVRILRAARFAARFNFKIADDTQKLMQQMVKAHEVDALVPERVTKELEKALQEPHPDNFFKVLEKCDALKILFPEININQQQLTILLNTAKITPKLALRFAALFSNTPADITLKTCKQYKIANELKDLALLVSKHLIDFKNFTNLQPDKILNFFMAADAFRREERFYNFLIVCEAATQVSAENIKNCYLATKSIDTKPIIEKYSGVEIKEKIHDLRLKAIAEYL